MLLNQYSFILRDLETVLTVQIQGFLTGSVCWKVNGKVHWISKV